MEVRTEKNKAHKTLSYEEGKAQKKKAAETQERPLTTIESTEAALKTLGITVRYNMLLKEAEVSGLPGYFSKENATAVLPQFLVDYMKACNYKGVSRQTVESCLDCIADKYRFNPIKEYLLSGNWDGKDRFQEVYHILGITNERYKTYVRKWFIQCVAIGLNDGEKPIGADGALVLQGGQGSGKTSFFRIMAPFDRAFVEGAVIDMRVKDTTILATKAWITELGELDNTIKKEQSSLKAFITLPEDKVRFPYARVDTISRRRTSFCGTVNPSDYLKDETGSRRFWTVPIETIDKKRLFSIPQKWIDQLWYQTYHMYLNNPNGFRLTDEEMENLQVDNREFEKPLRGELELLDILDFSIPTEQWKWWGAVQIAEKIGGNIDPSQAGKAARKILTDHKGKGSEKEWFKKANKGNLYLLPLPDKWWETL